MQNTQSDYRKELEKAAKRMILIHDVDTLVKLILRSTVRFLCIEICGFIIPPTTKGITKTIA